jgi:two-component system response regulator FixJ
MQKSESPSSRNAVAVIVDDDPAVRNSLKFFLEVEGLSVRAYANAADALQEANYPVRGCLIIDYRLPGMTGLDLLALLRERRITLPAILITTNPSSYLVSRTKAAGATLVEKPLLNEALHEAVQLALKSPDQSPH